MPADPMEFLTDGVDVRWNVGEVPGGIPFVVVCNTGPMWSSYCSTFEPTDLRVRQALAVGGEDAIKRHIVYDHPHLKGPILTIDPDPQFQRFERLAQDKGSWILFLQFDLEGAQYTRMWVVYENPAETVLIKGDGTLENGSKKGWIIPFWEGSK